MDDRFYHSFLPPIAKICGRKLTTFSLWHHLVLSAIGSPVALGGERVTISDLLVAVRVCGLQYGGTNIRPTIRDAWWGRKLKKNPDLFRRQVESFYDWMAKQSSPPKFLRVGVGDAVSNGVESAPRCLGLVCSLMTRGGMQEATAWNCSLGRAMWMDAQFAQIHGVNLRFLDDADLDDSEVDLSSLTDDEAMIKFQRELPEELIGATFDYWLCNIKRKDGKP